ncbi:putative quinol monooxygenase [Paenibacillus doosanensis]|uniref:putative quinol monooxygenase n=1 Tax=Paenibacillus doosanensis TaxID=1229154 RepID=UPI0035C85648
MFEAVDQENAVLFVETWADSAALERHARSSHFTGFVQSVQADLAGPFQPEIFHVVRH